MIDLPVLAQNALSDLKGQNIELIDVAAISDVTDTMIIASGTSTRHVKALAANVLDALKEYNLLPIGVEGLEAADWVLVDFGSVVIHVMLPETRRFYDLEKLWSPIETASPVTDDLLGAPNTGDMN